MCKILFANFSCKFLYYISLFNIIDEQTTNEIYSTSNVMN